METLKQQKIIQTFLVTFWVEYAMDQTNEEATASGFYHFISLVIVIALTWILYQLTNRNLTLLQPHVI